MTGSVIVLMLTGGPVGLMDGIRELMVGTPLGEITGNATVDALHHSYTNAFARGFLKDAGSALSLLLGVLSTQTYAQAIWSGKSHSAARRGALLSAFLIPPIGIACILIGLFMRSHCITADELAALTQAGAAVPDSLLVFTSSAQVFPAFIVHYMPSLFGGMVLGTLIITVVGGGAGLSLGVSTILVKDIINKIRQAGSDAQQLIVTRITIVAVLLSAMLIALVVPGAIINDFGFLSMGLRGTVVFLPMSAALFLKGRIAPRWALASILLGPITVLAGNFVALPCDPLFPGVAVSFLLLAGGYFAESRK